MDRAFVPDDHHVEREKPEPGHNHAYGRGACPHPDCVGYEDRRLDKIIATSLAQRLKDHEDKDVQKLANLVLKLVQV